MVDEKQPVCLKYVAMMIPIGICHTRCQQSEPTGTELLLRGKMDNGGGPGSSASPDAFDGKHCVAEVADEEEEEEEDVGLGRVSFVPGPLVPLKEQLEKDKDDESLRRWKEQLLGCVEGDLNDEIESKVTFESIGVVSSDFSEITLPLPTKESESPILFSLKEGSVYYYKVKFLVQHNIVSGLRYKNTVRKNGLKVDQCTGMLGTFAPQRDQYVHILEEHRTPSGPLARGNYKAKLKFEDDDKRCHLDLDYCFEIKK